MLLDKYVDTHTVRKALLVSAALLLFEIFFLWLAFEKHARPFWDYVDGYHTLVSLVVTAAVLLTGYYMVHRTRPHRFASLTFLAVFLLYNPLVPLLYFTQLSGVDTLVTANMITAAFFIFKARRLRALDPIMPTSCV